MNRTPPQSVRKRLRTEAGFCCAVPHCGIPYLTYHHFDPPWSVREHHNPAGMIALCLPHHSEADGRVYTVDQLREFKATAKDFTSVGGRSNWRRENTLIVIGGSYTIDTPQILVIRDNPILWLTKSSEGNDLINMDLRGPTGEPLFSMRDNDWLAFPPVDDIIAPPQHRSLSIRSNSTSVSLDMHFTAKQPELIRKMIIDQAAGEALRKRREQILNAGGYFMAGETLVCQIACQIVWPERVWVKHDGISVGSNNLIGSMSINNRTAIAIGCTKNAGAGFAFG
jgi:hypothetical protein